ncbi:MAG: hypothetical protein R2712_22310 [Vicinamibacterales bacterium]
MLARSFRACHQDIPFFVLLADEPVAAVDPAAEPFTLVTLADLDVPDLPRLRFHHPQQPFSYACTPWLIEWLHARGVDRVVYFKQETLILDDVSGLFDRLATSPIVVTPHLPQPLGADGAERELNILLSGVYNVGVLGVARHASAREFLTWWADRLRYDCRHAVEAGLHFEQRWVDLAIAYFDGVHVERDPAYNVGHWSLPERAVTRAADGRVQVDGRPCRVFRFSGYRPEEGDRMTTYNARLPWEGLGVVRELVRGFREALEHDGYWETREWPYAYERFDNGVRVAETARQIYRTQGDAVARFGDPLSTGGSGSFWRWLHSHPPESDLSRFWKAIYDSRPDLQGAFPDTRGDGARAFMTWARHSGLAEHQVPEAMLTGSDR